MFYSSPRRNPRHFAFRPAFGHRTVAYPLRSRWNDLVNRADKQTPTSSFVESGDAADALEFLLDSTVGSLGLAGGEGARLPVKCDVCATVNAIVNGHHAVKRWGFPPPFGLLRRSRSAFKLSCVHARFSG